MTYPASRMLRPDQAHANAGGTMPEETTDGRDHRRQRPFELQRQRRERFRRIDY